jgi:hypothetical protein
MPAKICCDQCGIDVDIRCKNEIYCDKCYDALAQHIDDLESPIIHCQSCNCDVSACYDEGYCQDCYAELKNENKELKEELNRLKNKKGDMK